MNEKVFFFNFLFSVCFGIAWATWAQLGLDPERRETIIHQLYLMTRGKYIVRGNYQIGPRCFVKITIGLRDFDLGQGKKTRNGNLRGGIIEVESSSIF